MANFEDDFRTLLEREAVRVAPDPARPGPAVARAGRARTARAWGTGATAVVAALAAISGAGAVVSGPDGDPARPAAPSPEAPSWRREAYPVLATGTYDGRSWILHVRDLDGPPEVVFEVEAPAASSVSFTPHTAWEGVDASFQGRIGGGREIVMGMVDAGAGSVTVVLTGGERIDAPVFGYDDETRYFLAFLPRGARGVVVARRAPDEVVGTAPLPGARGRAGVATGCPDDHRSEPGDGDHPVIGRGTYDGRRWALTLIEDPDAAHPEDLASENPELEIEIEGGWPNGGSMETYSRWEGVSPPFHDALRGGHAYAFGMAAAEADTVTVEPDAGDPVEAELFDARGVPAAGAQAYVAFFPRGTTGDVVARTADGTEIGRVPLGLPPDAPMGCGIP